MFLRRAWVSVSEYILHDAPVSGCDHGMESSAIFDLIYVRPCRQIYISPFAESEFFTVYDHVEITLYDNEHKMVLRLPWFGVDDVVFANDFSCEDIVVNVALPADVFFAEKYRRTAAFLPFVTHFRNFVAQI